MKKDTQVVEKEKDTKRKNISFNLFGTKWTIKFVDMIPVDEDGAFKFGCCNLVKKQIQVATKDPFGDPIMEREIQLTTLHEIVHAIFSDGSYLESNADEPLVEWVAKCLLSLKEQKVLQ